MVILVQAQFLHDLVVGLLLHELAKPGLEVPACNVATLQVIYRLASLPAARLRARLSLSLWIGANNTYETGNGRKRNFKERSQNSFFVTDVIAYMSFVSYENTGQ